MPQQRLPVRLMLREEGEFWNAYFGSGPKDAFMLGSIRMSIVHNSATAKETFMKLMSDVMADAIRDATGQRPTMNVERAPESERSGHG